MNNTQRETLTDLIGSFIWNFKKGDNIIYNFEILFELYKSKKTLRSQYLNKPIVLIIAAIIECVLDDFTFRVKQHVYDKIPNISLGVINSFRGKKLEKFEHYISKVIEFDLFDQTPDFYNDLKLLQDMRNRLHIQNKNYKLDKNECNIFTDLNLSKSERILRTILLKMCSKFPRRDVSEATKNASLKVIEQMITGTTYAMTTSTNNTLPEHPHPDEPLESEDCPYCRSGLTNFGELCPYCRNICTIP